VGVWVRYALVAALVTAVLGLATTRFVPGTQPQAVWLAALVAYAVQLVAFGVLVRGQGRPGRFLVGWAGGMLLRFAGLAGMAIWVTVSDAHHAESALLSLIGFVMVLVLLEPVFLRMVD